jgi:hypothetical protein
VIAVLRVGGFAKLAREVPPGQGERRAAEPESETEFAPLRGANAGVCTFQCGIWPQVSNWSARQVAVVG